MAYGIIKIPVTDLRARPDSTSERRSQVLFGASVEIGGTQKGFSRVTLLDKYTGWCRDGHIHKLNEAKWRKYVARSKQKVKSEIVVIKSGLGIATYPFRLFFGTELIIRSHKGDIHFELPGGIRARISTRCLNLGGQKDKSPVIGKKLVTTAARFIGVPYLWGGITPLGFDCSGLVQMVYGFHGIILPRDSKDQMKVGSKVDRTNLVAGDLLFFPGHVAISCGGSKILHASAGRGMVTYDSLDPEAPDYREDLDRDFLFARRLMP
jgi:hypothetical protein